MQQLDLPAVIAGPAPQRPARVRRRREAGLGVALAGLTVVAGLSIAVGSRSVPFDAVLHALVHPTGTPDDTVVRELRVPRTVLGLLAGAALGLAGTLMQALTRNPLADPGIFGINQGAAAAVVLAITVFGITSPLGFVWFAFAGAIVATVVVYGVGSGRRGVSPIRLALAGIAIQYALTGVNQAMQLFDRAALDRMRFWIVGSLANRDPAALWRLAPFMIAGMLLSLLLARSLNAVNLGDDTARAIGVNLGRTRALSLVAITLLCGGATAACGPIAFVGLMVPHLVRAITGPDQRWVLPYSMIVAPILLLGSDVIGRIVARPAEIQVGIVTDVIGGIVFIALARRRRLVQL